MTKFEQWLYPNSLVRYQANLLCWWLQAYWLATDSKSKVKIGGLIKQVKKDIVSYYTSGTKNPSCLRPKLAIVSVYPVAALKVIRSKLMKGYR